MAKSSRYLNKNIWDSIAIVIATNLLHKDIKHVTSKLLE